MEPTIPCKTRNSGIGKKAGRLRRPVPESYASRVTRVLPPSDRQTTLVMPVKSFPWALRRLHTRLNEAPPHLTLLFPFLPYDAIDRTVTSALTDLFSRFSKGPIHFTEVDWFDQRVVWLKPSSADLFKEMTQALVERFPECRPYDGEFSDVVPHATLAADKRRPLMILVEALGRLAIPLTEEFSEVWLMAMGDRGQWERRCSFELGG